MRGQTCVRRPDRLPACFGMRLVDGHGVRPQELGPSLRTMFVNLMHTKTSREMFWATDTGRSLHTSPCFLEHVLIKNWFLIPYLRQRLGYFKTVDREQEAENRSRWNHELVPCSL